MNHSTTPLLLSKQRLSTTPGKRVLVCLAASLIAGSSVLAGCSSSSTEPSTPEEKQSFAGGKPTAEQLAEANKHIQGGGGPPAAK